MVFDTKSEPFLELFKFYQELNEEKGTALLNNESKLVYIRRFFEVYYELSNNGGFDFIEFVRRDLSSGEEALINLVSRLYSFKPEKSSSYLILIDEGEVYLHPQWQREYMQILLEYLNYYFREANSVQVLITSNSPFIVSDLTNEDIIYLEKNKTRITINENIGNQFGGNFYDILNHSFFMDDGFIGKIAENEFSEIERIFANIDTLSDECILELRDRIKIIGDELIKRKLNKDISVVLNNKDWNK